MAVSADDRSEILDLMARYCWFVDEGDGDGWAGLWTSDGQFTGIPDPVSGHEQLKAFAPGFRQAFGGKFRHHISNVMIDEGKDGALDVKAYSVLTNWTDGGSLASFAKANYTLVKDGGKWKIKALHADMMG